MTSSGPCTNNLPLVLMHLDAHVDCTPNDACTITHDGPVRHVVTAFSRYPELVMFDVDVEAEDERLVCGKSSHHIELEPADIRLFDEQVSFAYPTDVDAAPTWVAQGAPAHLVQRTRLTIPSECVNEPLPRMRFALQLPPS